MSSHLHLVVPGPLDQRTGGYIYDRRIVAGLRALGHSITVHELDGRFPLVDDTACTAATATLEVMADGLPIIDGLALPAFVGLLGRLPPWVALIHHPLALETGLTPAEAEAFAALEQRLLRGAARIIVTSPQTRRDLAAYDVDPGRVAPVLPGTDPAPLARGSNGSGCALLCIASLTPRKGHLMLIDALSRLGDLDWHLTCVGSCERDPATARAVAAAITQHGLEDRVRLVGEQIEADLGPFYDRADLFVLASHHEGYGMVLAEALARGLPIVSTTAGAIPNTVPKSAGLLVPPGDAAVLSETIRLVLSEPTLRGRLAAGARAARANLPSWNDAAAAFARELQRVAPG